MAVYLNASDGDDVWSILLAGQKVPRFDSAAGYAQAERWITAAQHLVDLGGRIGELHGFIDDAVGGATAEAFRNYFRKLDEVVPKLAGVAQGQAQAVHQVALQVEHT